MAIIGTVPSRLIAKNQQLYKGSLICACTQKKWLHRRCNCYTNAGSSRQSKSSRNHTLSQLLINLKVLIFLFLSLFKKIQKHKKTEYTDFILFFKYFGVNSKISQEDNWKVYWKLGLVQDFLAELQLSCSRLMFWWKDGRVGVC